jgi:hypothetical protein
MISSADHVLDGAPESGVLAPLSCKWKSGLGGFITSCDGVAGTQLPSSFSRL